MVKLLLIVAVFLNLASCGTNVFETVDYGKVENEAAAELEKDNPDKAISLLEEALLTDPNNAIYISLLSEAYAQKFGVSLLDIALAMASSATALASSSTDLVRIWSILPAPSEAVLTGVSYAVELLESIASTKRTDTDNFKLSLLAVTLVNLQLKALDTDGDGNLSAEELANLTVEDATTLITALG